MVYYPWLVLQVGYQVFPTLPPHLQPMELLQKAAASLTKVGQPVSTSASAMQSPQSRVSLWLLVPAAGRQK